MMKRRNKNEVGDEIGKQTKLEEKMRRKWMGKGNDEMKKMKLRDRNRNREITWKWCERGRNGKRR